ncbi:hypothetical protein JKY72_00995 [Candidatus Gracilibacteria bacterium]|nr:hypothetical protein [Candidatus Gracilibacteria bacterium]
MRRNMNWAMTVLIVLASVSLAPAPAMSQDSDCTKCCRRATPSWAAKRRALVKRYGAEIAKLEAALATSTADKSTLDALRGEIETLRKGLENAKKEAPPAAAADEDPKDKPLPRCIGAMVEEIGALEKRLAAIKAQIRKAIEAAGFEIVEKDKASDKPVEEPDPSGESLWKLRVGGSVRGFVAIDEGNSPVITVISADFAREVYPRLDVTFGVSIGVSNMKVDDGDTSKESHPVIFMGKVGLMGEITSWLDFGPEGVISLNEAPFTGEQNQMTMSINAVILAHSGWWYLKLSGGWVVNNDNSAVAGISIAATTGGIITF